MKYLLAHDLGTSGNKATLFSTEGELVQSVVRGYGCHYFNGNWAEQNADDWWSAVVETTKKILDGRNPADVVAVSFSGQMQGCLCVDKDGVPLRPSIIWADQRSEKEVEMIRNAISDDEYYRITANRNSSTYSLQKLAWIRRNQPEVYDRTYKSLNAKDYMVFKLTGRIATEYSDAGCTGMMDAHTMRWSEDTMKAAGCSVEKLPELIPSTEIAGGVTKEAAGITGLIEGTPVVMGGGDGCCAAVGAGSVENGNIYCILGSSSWIASQSAGPVLDKSKITFSIPSLVPGQFNQCGSMQAAGVSYSWMMENLCQNEVRYARENNLNVYDYIDSLIGSSPAGAGGIIFLPYLLGERAPRWDPNARGSFIGLTRRSSHSDMLRAVMEGVSLNLGVIMQTFRLNKDYKEMTVIGGGAKSAVWRQMLADVLNIAISVPDNLEQATSMGAVCCAGVGVGVFKDFTDINRFIRHRTVTKPNAENAEIYKEKIPIFNDCYNALKPVFKKISEEQHQKI